LIFVNSYQISNQLNSFAMKSSSVSALLANLLLYCYLLN
jgi:hypothetical protein